MFSKVSIGVDWNGEGWSLAVLRQRFGRIRVMGRLRAQGTAEDARQSVAGFVDKHRLREAPATACLPRRHLLVRFLDLPAEAESRLTKVVGFQIDTLHPFGEGGVYWDCGVVSRDRERKQIKVLIVLAEKARLDQHCQELVRLGLRFTSLTLAAACLAPILKAVAGEAALVVFCRPDGVELLGFSRSALCATRDVPAESGEGISELFERELHAVRAALSADDPAAVLTFMWGRPPEPLAGLLADIPPLPEPKLDWVAPPCSGLEESWPALGAAYADLNRKSVAAPNLLPAERRWRPARQAPRVVYALGSLAVLLAVVTGAHSWIAKTFYARALSQQIDLWQGRAGAVRKQIQQAEGLEASADVLEGAREQTWMKLRVLAELTKLLPVGTWLQQIDVDQDSVEIFGYSDRAADLVQPLENSPYFSRVEFTSPITRDASNKEIFRIHMQLEKPLRP
jgi:Tfp pilus assembly protein PilN